MKNIYIPKATRHEKTLDPQITADDFKTLMQKTRESTSSSPSKVHVGHYIVASFTPALCELFSTMISIPFSFGFSPKRWRKSIHVMLPKIPGKPLINKLRIIQLIEADLNAYLKIKVGKQLMHHVEKRGILGNQMHGGRPNRTANDAILTQTLMNNYITIMKSPAYIVILDAEQCYDRIAHFLVPITLARLGAPLSLGQSLAQTLSKMEHHVKTASGVSTNSIRKTKEETWSGVVQGSGASSLIWLSVEAPMIDTFATFISGTNISSPNNVHKFKAIVNGYIDDNNTTRIYKENVSDSTIIQDANKALMAWGKNLEETGGKLSKEKSITYIYQWKWNNNQLILRNVLQDQIQAHGINHATIRAPNDPQKYLGLHMSTIQNFHKEYDLRIEQANEYSHRLGKASLSPTEALISFSQVYLPSIRYVFPYTNFSSKQLKKLQSIILSSLLPKIGINRHFPRAIVHGPINRGGLGISNMELLQGIDHVLTIVRQLRNESPTSELIRLLIQQTQLEYGQPEIIFQHKFPNKNYLTKTWITDIWKFTSEKNIQLNCNTALPQPLQRVNDTYLMKEFQPWYTTNQLIQLNLCRMFLHAITLDDIVKNDGETIKEQCIKNHIPMESKLSWPNIPIPTEAMWKMWKKQYGFVSWKRHHY